MDLDPVQILIVVIAMGAGFVQWLWKLVQEKSAVEQRAAEEREADRQRLMEEMQQRGGKGGLSVSTPARPRRPDAPPTYQADPWSTVRDVLERAREASAPPPSQPLPPPLPQRENTGGSRDGGMRTLERRTRPGTVQAELKREIARTPNVSFSAPAPLPAPTPLVVLPVNAPGAIKAPVLIPLGSIPPPRARKNEAADLLRGVLKDNASLRQAFLLSEILGPPKALQSSGDSAI